MSEEESGTEDVGRPFWSGTVSFGLVNVPVGMYPANRSISASLRMVTEEKDDWKDDRKPKGSR